MVNKGELTPANLAYLSPPDAREAERVSRRFWEGVWVPPDGELSDANTPGTTTATVIGGDCDADPTQLPGVALTWEQPTVPASTTFDRYRIWRRTLGAASGGFYTALAGDWDKIAEIAGSPTTLAYSDYEVASRWDYQYAVSVVFQGVAAAFELGPPASTPVAIGRAEFDFLFLHTEVGDFVRLDTLEAEKTRQRSQREIQVWGRPKPVVAISENSWHVLQVPALSRELVPTERMWWRLQAMMDNEYANAASVVVRFGKARELYYAQFGQMRQRQAEVSFRPSVAMTETHHAFLGGTFPGFFS